MIYEHFGIFGFFKGFLRISLRFFDDSMGFSYIFKGFLMIFQDCFGNFAIFRRFFGDSRPFFKVLRESLKDFQGYLMILEDFL